MESPLSSCVQHYDGCSEHYQSLWGIHIHHGLWRNDEWSKERAQDNLVDELLARSGLRTLAAGRTVHILDVGCGVGGTSCRLAGLLDAKCTGISLSPKQVEMATANAAAAGVADRVSFHQGDGEALPSHPALQGKEGTFDAVWISEALSHFPHKDSFFAGAVSMLKPGGRLVLCDWFKAEGLGRGMTAGVIADIEKGMLLPPMETPSGYVNLAVAAGLRPLFYEDVSKETARTWDVCLELITNPSLWAMATTMGSDFVDFLVSFKAMRDGFASGAFRFSLLVMEKPTLDQVV